MNDRKRHSYQADDIRRLREENKGLQSEIRILSCELERKDKTISDLKSSIAEIALRNKKIMREHEERMEQLAEAAEFYKSAAKSAREIERKFKEMIASFGVEIKR